MPPSIKKLADKAVSVVEQGDAPLRPSKVPSVLRFPLLVLLNLALSALLYSSIADYTGGDLAGVSRSLDQWEDLAAVLGWKTFELGLGWYANYDSYDLVALTLLSHGPTLYLLGTFYELQPTTVLSSLIIDCVTTYIPFRLLRPLSLAHAVSKSSHSVSVPNREVITDFSIQTFTTLLAASIYSVTLYSAFASFLPVYLVTYFSDIPSIAAAHSASPISLFPLCLLLGIASRSFVFTPAVAAKPSLKDIKATAFNPSTATFAETIRYNLWGYDTRTRVVIQRTTVLMLVAGANTFVQTFVTIKGVEMIGAAVYSGVWVVVAGITGAVLGVVGAV